MKVFRTGVVGTGFIGVAHVEALRRMGNVEVVAIADTMDVEKKAAAMNVPHAYSCYREMIDKEALDVVHICTPNSTHYEIAMYAMEHGVNVVCEKPLTRTSEEAEEMLALARKTGLMNAVNFNNRFNPMPFQLKQMISKGDLGDIYSVHGEYLQDWLYLDTDYSWRLEPALSGDSRAIADIGSHWIDLVESMTGLRAVEVLADFSTVHKTRKKPLKPVETYSGMALRPEDYEDVPISTEDYANVLFHFEGGALGSLVVSQVFAGRKNQITVSVSGSKCAARWDSEHINEMWVGHRERFNEQVVKDPSILYPETAAIIDYPGGHVEGFPDTFKQNFKQIYRAIEQKDAPHDFATFEAGLREMRMCEAIVRSARCGGWVKVED